MPRRKPKPPKPPKPPEQPGKPLQRDRAFRALANESPEIIPRLLVALGIAPPGEAPPVIESLATGLDPPAPRIEADLVVRYEDAGVRHVEWQGWPDAGFRSRVFGYHLNLTVKYAPTPVRTVIIWSRVPSQEEIAPYVTGQMILTFDHIILAHLDPDLLLADSATACFAMACRTDNPAALAARVVAALQGAPPRAAAVAALAAAAVSDYIYEVFRSEWEARGMEPIIIEELARMLEDKGAERGREIGRREGEQLGRREGEQIGRRQAIVDLAEAYDIPLDERRRAWIASASLAELEQVRVALKRDRAWPTLPRGVRPRNEGSGRGLDDTERALVLGVLLEEILAWTRQLSGTSRLRALVVFDEVFGYLPPHPHNPPTKRPLVALLKQARAFGVGVVVATQNPMDLDYRALGNAGLWCLGRLQTDADRERVVDGLGMERPRGGKGLDPDALLQKLAPRWFLVRNVHAKDEPMRLVQPRWAMSFLKGPMTRVELLRAIGDRAR